MILNLSLCFSLEVYKPAVMPCLLMIVFALKAGKRDVVHFVYAIDMQRAVFQCCKVKIASRGLSLELSKQPGRRTLNLEPVGFSHAKRINLVGESMSLVPAQTTRKGMPIGSPSLPSRPRPAVLSLLLAARSHFGAGNVTVLVHEIHKPLLPLDARLGDDFRLLPALLLARPCHRGSRKVTRFVDVV
jgi:hypothetical protein